MDRVGGGRLTREMASCCDSEDGSVGWSWRMTDRLRDLYRGRLGEGLLATIGLGDEVCILRN